MSLTNFVDSDYEGRHEDYHCACELKWQYLLIKEDNITQEAVHNDCVAQQRDET